VGMARKLTVLANPPRVVQLRGRAVTWLPLTLRDLAAIEAQHGSITEFFQSALEGHITPILKIITLAIQKANPNLSEDEIADMFQAGDILSPDAPGAKLLQEILAESGLVVSEEKKE
jgi:hypothetical protein